MTFRRALTATTAGVAVIALTAACGVRIGTPPAPIPSPDETEQVRQQLARNAAGVVELTGRTTAGASDIEPELGELFESVSTVAVDQARDLGGVWVPPPRPADDAASPSAIPSPSPSTADPAPLSPESAVAELTDSLAEVARLAAQDLPSDWTAVVGSMLVSRRSMVAAGRQELGLDCGPVCPEPVAEVSLNDGATKEAIVAHLDAIGYLSEVAAARASGEERERHRKRAADYRAVAQAMIGASDGTDADPRRPAYSIGEDGPLPSIQLLQGDLVSAWITAAQESRGAERAAALEQAWTAYLGAHGGPAVSTPWPGLLSGPAPTEPDRSTP